MDAVDGCEVQGGQIYRRLSAEFYLSGPRTVGGPFIQAYNPSELGPSHKGGAF